MKFDDLTCRVTPRLIRYRDAPNYLGMCRDVFERDVRPFVTEIPIGGRGVAFDRFDLDACATYLKLNKGKPPVKSPPWQQPERAEFHMESIVKPRKKKLVCASPMKTENLKVSNRVKETIALCVRTSQEAARRN